jgi:hypothetical protein
MKNLYKVEGDTTLVYINSKVGVLTTIIDTEDLPLIDSFKTSWNVTYRTDAEGFDGVRTKVQKKGQRVQYWMHRIVMQYDGEGIIDHIDGNTLNNRKSNLRIADFQLNSENKRLHTSSKTGYRGVFLEKGKYYRVRFVKEGKRYNFGNYPTLEEAIEVADRARKELFPLSR